MTTKINRQFLPRLSCNVLAISNMSAASAAGLTLSVHLLQLSSLPVGLDGAADGLAVSVTLAEAARSLAGRGETAQLAVLHHRVAYPVDLRICANGLVGRVDQDDLEEFVCRVLADPVRVEHTESAAHTTTDTFLIRRKIREEIIFQHFRKCASIISFVALSS